MNKAELLALPNWALATLYSEWSEDTYAAGWMQGREAQFVKTVLAGEWSPPRDNEDGATLRALLENAPNLPEIKERP